MANTPSKNIVVGVVCIVLAAISVVYPNFLLRIKANFLQAETEHKEIVNLPADDPRVIEFIKERVLVPPSTAPYNLEHGPNFDTSDGQAQIIDKILGKKRDGFFVESGAFTGDELSNTLLFETQRGWKGLLIEPDKRNYAKVLSKNRKAYAANSCLGLTKVPENVVYREQHQPHLSHILDSSNDADVFGLDPNLQPITCYPLVSFLLALNISTVDYFSLDVEASEYKVLESIEWDKVDIKTISVEWNLIPEGRDALRTLMKSKGYIFYMEFRAIHTHDFIFVKKGVLPETEARKKLPLLREDLDPRQLLTGRDQET